MITIAHKFLVATSNAGDVISRLRMSQFQDLIQDAVTLGADASLAQVLDELAQTSRINDGAFQLENKSIGGKQLIRILSNMLAVYVAKTFIFAKGGRTTLQMKSRYPLVCELLPKLIAADKRWKLVSDAHRTFICDNLPTELQSLSDWCSPVEGQHAHT